MFSCKKKKYLLRCENQGLFLRPFGLDCHRAAGDSSVSGEPARLRIFHLIVLYFQAPADWSAGGELARHVAACRTPSCWGIHMYADVLDLQTTDVPLLHSEDSHSEAWGSVPPWASWSSWSGTSPYLDVMVRLLCGPQHLDSTLHWTDATFTQLRRHFSLDKLCF